MLKFVSKEDYWKVLDSGIMEGIPDTGFWHLKDIQDAMAYSHLCKSQGLQIAEVGAGHSRLLGVLAKTNTCCAIDEYKGAGGGPKVLPKDKNVRVVNCNVGASRGLIADASFDALFSVSVVEHVLTKDLKAFFDDCHRILRPGGIMIHLIDAYLENDAASCSDLWLRIAEYLRPLRSGQFEASGPIELNGAGDLMFRTSYATNPDNMMRRWNKSAPVLAPKRARAQSCAIEMVGRRI